MKKAIIVYDTKYESFKCELDAKFGSIITIKNQTNWIPFTKYAWSKSLQKALKDCLNIVVTSNADISFSVKVKNNTTNTISILQYFFTGEERYFLKVAQDEISDMFVPIKPKQVILDLEEEAHIKKAAWLLKMDETEKIDITTIIIENKKKPLSELTALVTGLTKEIEAAEQRAVSAKYNIPGVNGDGKIALDKKDKDGLGW